MHFELVQAEEVAERHAIFESIPSECEVVVNHHFIHEADVKQEQDFVDEYDEEALTILPAANDHEADGSSNKVIDISEDE